MDAGSSVLPEIGAEQTRGDDMARMGLHRQRQAGQGRLDQRRVVVAEPALRVRRERIDNSGSLRAVPLAIGEKLRQVIRRAEREELIENGKVALLRVFDAPAHGRVALASAGAKHERVEGAPDPDRLLLAAMRVLLWLDGVEVAPPDIAV